MTVSEKYWKRFYYDEKLPRKIKKAIIGTKPTKKALKERIAKVIIEIHNPFDNGYTFQAPNDNFCPYCGCEHTHSTGNMAAYPEDYTKYFCARCKKLVAMSDNGYVWHALFEFKGIGDGEV